jgi:hypothetical protein
VKTWLDMRRQGRFMHHWVNVLGKDINASSSELECGHQAFNVHEACGGFEVERGILCIDLRKLLRV